MNDPPTFPSVRDLDPARSAADADTAVTCLDWPVVHVARDVMTRNPDRVACSDTLMEVARRMRDLLVAFLPVCDERGYLKGIIGLRDLQRVDRSGDHAGVTASSLAEEPPVTIGVDDPVDHVSDLMAEQRVWLLPVLDGPRLVGVIHYASITGTSNPAIPAHPPGKSPRPSP
jgi:CBS domain-containing protein